MRAMAPKVRSSLAAKSLSYLAGALPEDVAHDLALQPKGSSYQPDLELAATIIQHDVWRTHFDIREPAAHENAQRQFHNFLSR
jgi:hypothetical protein